MNILEANHPLSDGRTTHAALVQALHGMRPERVPVWFMRQAGRSLPEYRKLRSGTQMLDACLDPLLAAEITLQPVGRHGVDAAIFFSDIVVPLKLAGVDVRIESGTGPLFTHPVRTASDVERVCAEFPAERLRAAVDPVRASVSCAVSALGATPLIGFAGGPFTLAAYLAEGGPSRDHLRARALMHAEPGAWQSLLTWAAELSSVFLEAQVRAGASAVQLFDSWAGVLSAGDYAIHAAPFTKLAFLAVRELRYNGVFSAGCGSILKQIPEIHFSVGADHLLERFAGLDTHAIGVDWRTPLDQASIRMGGAKTVQGNIDPALLCAPADVLESHVRTVIDRGRLAPAHVLNLGHGVPPQTDPTVLTRIVEIAHAC